jgi:hypothetical protein
MMQHSISTRELNSFYDHYQQSNHAQRCNMVSDPDLFLKAQRLFAIEKQAKELQAGPIGKWQSQLRLIRHTLAPLIPLASTVFIPRQETTERRQLLDMLNAAQTQFNLLTDTVRGLLDAYERNEADYYQSASKGTQPPHHQPTA